MDATKNIAQVVEPGSPPRLDIDLDSFDFSPTVDPVTADGYALQLQRKLEERKLDFQQIKPLVETGEVDPSVVELHQAGINKLEAKFSEYRELKRKQRQPLFSFREEVQARKNKLGQEALARDSVKTIQASDDSFLSMFESEADVEEYKRRQSYMTDKKYLRNKYTIEKILRQAGFSEGEIESGIAEPMFRKQIGASKNQPTLEAVSKWGLDTINVIEKRKTIGEATAMGAMKDFYGVMGGLEEFEKSLANDYSRISDEDRIMVRQIYTRKQQELKEQYGKVLPTVSKIFNTVATEEGIDPIEGVEGYSDYDEAIREFGKLTKPQFAKALRVMANMAEIRGQDVDGFMNKLGKNFTRAVTGIAREFSTPLDIQTASSIASVASEIASGKRNQQYIVERFDKDGNSLGYNVELAYRLADIRYGDTLGQTIRSERIPLTPEQVEKDAPQFTGGSVRVIQDPDEQKKVIETLESQKRALEYQSEIYNWRETVANVGSENWFVNDWVYGIARSLPEMGAAATGVPGLLLVASAQQERNMAEFRRTNPTKDPNDPNVQARAWAGATAYSLLNRLQFKTATAAMPKTKAFLENLQNPLAKGAASILGFTGLVTAEAVQETAQDLSFPLAMNFYGGLDSDIQGFTLSKEIEQAIENFPRMMFAMVPFVIAGQVGRAALNHVEGQSFLDVVRNKDIMDRLNIDEQTQQDLLEMTPEELADFAKENAAEIFGAVAEDLPGATPPEFNAQIIPRENGTFTVTNGDNTLQTRSAEEAAAAVRQLDIEFDARVAEQGAKEAQKRPQPIDLDSDAQTGVNVQFEPDPELENLTEDQLLQEKKVAEAEVEKLEIDLDKAFEDDVDFDNYRGLRVAQQRLGQIEVEQIRREAADKYGPDVFMDLYRAVTSAGKPNTTAIQKQKGREIQALVDVLMQKMQSQEMTGQEIQDEFQAVYSESVRTAEKVSDEDLTKNFEAAFKKVQEWVEFIQDYEADVDQQAIAEGVIDIGGPTSESSAEFSAELAAVMGANATQTTLQSSAGSQNLAAAVVQKWELSLDPKIQTTPLGHVEVTQALVKTLKDLGIKSGIRGGRKMPKGVLGTYNIYEGIIKVLKHGDVTTAAHEMAHAIQDQYLFPRVSQKAKNNLASDKDWRGVNSAVLTDLSKVANDYYGGGGMIAELSQRGILITEGFAEFIRLKMQGEDMVKIAPEADKWFNTEILGKNKKFKSNFSKASELIKRYGLQGSLNRAKGNIAKTPSQFEKAQQQFFDLHENFTSRYVEMLDPLKKIVAEAERLSGKKVEDIKNPYLVGKQYRMTHDSIVKEMVETGMIFANGKTGGFKTSLRYALQDIGSADKQNFAIYLWARRTASFTDPKTGAMKLDTGLSFTDAATILTKLDSPKFRRAAQLVYEWNNNVLQYAADTSRDYAEVVKNIRKYDPGNYIPLSREFKRITNAWKSLPPGANTGKLVKKLKGSSKRIKDPFESMISNASGLVLRSHQRRVVELLLTLKEEVPKLGPVITKADPQTIPVAQRGAADVMDAIAGKLNTALSKEAAELAEKIRLDPTDADAMVTLWGQAYVPKDVSENAIIPIFRNGKREFYEVDRTAYEALGGMETYRLQPWLDATVGRTNRIWRAGTTSFSATFQFVTNPIRDVRTLHAHTQTKAGFLNIMGTWAKTMAEGFAESISAKGFQTDWQKLFDQLGVGMTTQLGQDSNYTKVTAERLFKGRRARLLHPGSILGYIKDIVQFAEKSTRLTEVKLIAREIGWNPSKPLTPELAQRFNLALREVTTDFSASGSIGRVINQVLPYTNAQMQGIRAHVRAYNRASESLQGKSMLHQYAFNQFMQRGYMVAAASIAGWLMYRDEEWWREMNASERYTHSYIPVDASVSPSGQDELLKIPKAFELDGLFMGMPVAALDSFYQQDPEAAVGWAKMFLASGLEPTLPVIGTYMLESEGAEDFFGRTVIPQSEEILDVEGERYRQFGPMTTNVAQKLGKMFDMSPRRIDHFVKSFFGRAGLDALEIFGTVEDDIREPHLTRLPVLGSLLHPMGQAPYSPKSVTEFYDIRDYTLARASKINQETKESREERSLRLMVKDAASAMAMAREVRYSLTKEEDIRELRRMETEIARQAIALFKEKNPNRSEFRRWERELKKLKSAGN